MRLAWGLEAPVGEYLSAHFPELTQTAMLRLHHAVAFVDRDNRMVGGLGLLYLAPWDGSLSIYMERACGFTPALLKELFGWAFRERRLARLTCHIARDNRRARRFVEGIGFRLEGVKRRAFDGRRDACVYGMTADECRWLKD